MHLKSMSEKIFITVIIPVKNEEHNIRDLLDSLVVQEQPFEIIIADAYSTDGTQKIVNDYTAKYGFIKLYRAGGTRGQGRNLGMKIGKGDAYAFIDADCIANPFWLKEARTKLKNADIVAGRTINIGYSAFEDLERVELFYKDIDVTYPSCNLIYKKDVIDKIGIFDKTFRTAEDIDLNYRAVKAGFKLVYAENAIVYHRTRSTFYKFIKQAFWNGFGRKQLTLKHGSLWRNYNVSLMLKHKITIWYLIRLVFALLGYFACKIFVAYTKFSR